MSTTYTQSIKVGMCAIACIAVFAMTSFAHAETSTSTATTAPEVTTPAPATSPAIAALMSQLAKLTELFNQLKTQMLGMKAEIKVLRDGIKEGSSGDDVREIQEILASDRLIYPAGLTTGYFGPLTTEAIKKFQAANGLAVTGVIDDATKAAFDTIREQRKIDGKIPLGLLKAPGLRGKFEDKMNKHCEQMGTPTTSTSTPPTACMHSKHHGDMMHDENDDEAEDDNHDSDDEDTDDDGDHKDEDTSDEDDSDGDSN